VRVGVVLESLRVPSWAAWIVAAIRDHDELELALAIVCGGLRPRRPSILFAAYEQLDRLVFRGDPDALRVVDVSGTLDELPRLQTHALRGAAGERTLRDEDVLEIHGRGLDVLVNLAGVAPSGRAVSAARYGVWTLHHGDPMRYRGEPALFWELFHAEPASVSALEMRADSSVPSRVIYRSASATDRISLQRNRNPSYWKASRFVLRRLEDLARSRWTPEREPQPDPEPISAPPGPSNTRTLAHVAKVAGRAGRSKWRDWTRREEWFLGFRERRADVLPGENAAPWQPVAPPPDRYWADPFVFAAEGETFVFLEQVRRARGVGELVVGRLEAGARLTDLEPILPASHHLSYPYVFRDGDRTFMIPESGEAGRVELWAATDLPLSWEPVASLLENVHAVDASVFRHAGLYWMWVNIAAPGARRDDEVFLYFSDALESGWTRHPRSPVVSDARRARPAGRPFIHDGALIRPAQDCTGPYRYGGRVVFHAVDVLTTDDYSERQVGSLTAAWAGAGAIGAHTYTFDGAWETADALRLTPRWRRRPYA
jgi:hypothetical protein